MSNTVIKIENVSKLYRLGLVGKKTLKDDLSRWLHRVRGKEDPFLKIGQENDRTKKGTGDYVWALKDISFDVQQGEVLGIVGRNGAGKSTLLKILSKVTSPTTGVVKSRGKIASLLEVGTGFHPDLTGRDNIFLNGAILGMTKKEIKSKFDEIVDFSGVERYIDTPVKRYSSGMYVRLAFSVAAHLDPEILIIDEVLAVGDAEFQKKCLGKMKDVSGQGRTVLFVSHNMTAVKNLCQRAILMEMGSVVRQGDSVEVVNNYLQKNNDEQLYQFFENESKAPGNKSVKMRRIEIIPHNHKSTNVITVDTAMKVEFEFWSYVTDRSLNLSLHLYTINEECVFNIGTESKYLTNGLHKGACYIPAHFLNDNKYIISLMIVAEKSYVIFNFEKLLLFEVHENRETSNWHGKRPGIIRPNFEFTLE